MAVRRGRIVGIDIDGVLADYVASLRVIAAEHENVTLPEGDGPTTFGMVEPGWLTHVSQWKRLHLRWGSGLVSQTPVLDSTAAGTLRRLRELGHKVVVVTARSAEPVDAAHSEVMQEATRTWLDAHGMVHDEVYFTADKSSAEWDLLIEDSPGQLTKLDAAGREVWVRDHPYNRGDEFGHLPRARHLADFAHKARLLG